MSTRIDVSKRRVLINSASALVVAVLDMSVLIWLQRYLLARISAEQYAVYPVIMAVMVFMPLVMLVLTSGIGRYVVEALAKNDDRRATQIVSTMFPVAVFVGMLILMAGGVLVYYMDKVLDIEPQWVADARLMMLLMIALFVARLLAAPFSVGLYVRQKFVLANLIFLGAEALRIGLLFVLLFAVSTRVLWVVVATTIANFIAAAVTLAISLGLVSALRFRMREIRWSVAREVTSFGAWNLVNELAHTVGTSAPPLILDKLATAIDVSCFYVGAMATRAVGQAAGVVLLQMEPILTSLHAWQDTKRLQNTYLRVGRYSLWAALLLAIPLIVYSREIVLLYVGEKYAATSAVMALLLLKFPLGYGHVLLSRLASATAQIGSLAWRMIVVESVNLALAVYLVWRWKMGAVGCALSMVIVMATLHPLLLWPLGLRMASLTFGRWLRETIWPVLLAVIPSVAVFWGLRFFLAPSSWGGLAGCSAIGMGCYCLTILLFCLKDYERKELATAARRVRAFLSARP